VSEAGIESDVDFGEERVLEILRGCQDAPVDALIGALIEAAQSSAPVQGDDITVVALRAG